MLKYVNYYNGIKVFPNVLTVLPLDSVISSTSYYNCFNSLFFNFLII